MAFNFNHGPTPSYAVPGGTPGLNPGNPLPPPPPALGALWMGEDVENRLDIGAFDFKPFLFNFLLFILL